MCYSDTITWAGLHCAEACQEKIHAEDGGQSFEVGAVTVREEEGEKGNDHSAILAKLQTGKAA